MRTHQRVNAGFAAVAALLILLTLAALGAFMISISNTQQITAAQDLRGSQAYWAARAGLEWAYANPVAACPSTSGAAAVRTLQTIEGFAVCVVCTRTTYSDPQPLQTVVAVTANAFSATPASCSVADLAALASAQAGTLAFVERSTSGAQEALTVAVEDASVAEGNAGTTALVLTISQSALSPLATTFNYASAAGTAASGAACGGATDFLAAAGSATIAAGSLNTTVTVQACGDSTVEGNENFTLTLSNAQNASGVPVFIGRATATATINNDD